MSTSKEPAIVKKYANRRLYHTGTSSYVTLEDLAKMVRNGEDFVVQDAKTGEDLTRSVLAQIIFEQENKEGQQLLPVAFLRQLIRFYGDSMQALVPSYLELSMENLTKDQKRLREQMEQTFGPATFQAIEGQVKANMALFANTLRMFNPLAAAAEKPKEEPQPQSAPASSKEIESLQRQLLDMQAQLDRLSRKP